MSGMVHDLITRADFQVKDFIHARKNAVVDVGDVREVLGIYEIDLKGETQRRKKFLKKKVQRVEHSLTPSGVKKLGDARKTLRMHIEDSRRKAKRAEKLIVVDTKEVENPVCRYGFEDGPDEFIIKMHQWGEYPIDDRRYYLHMVFRYYLKQYHDHAVSAGVVIPHPSYQFILDTLYPNDSATRFPPEFRSFLADAFGRSFSTVSLPVPLKSSAREVTREHNFEEIPNVSTLRRKIESIVVDWKRQKTSLVYPSYLRMGNVHNNRVVERECFARKVRLVKNGMERIVGFLTPSTFEKLTDKVPKAKLAYDEYTSHNFKTLGEQLSERMGFFMRSSYREIFFALHDFSLVEDLFAASGAGMEVFTSFQSFCTVRKNLVHSFEKDECLCRSLLMVLVDVCFLFHIFDNRRLADEDPTKVITDVLRDIENINKSDSGGSM